MNEMRQGEFCYLCGTREQLTDDHLPPEGFFPTPKPSNLITTRCCSSCNGSFSLDDEAFRIFACSLMGRSPAAARIWSEKVMGSSFVRSPKLKANVAKHLVKLPVRTSTGVMDMDGLTIPTVRANRFLIRLTKGLIHYFYPEVNYKDAVFKVEQKGLGGEILDFLSQNAIYDARGEKTFRFWRMMVPKGEPNGLWAYAFYDASLFMVYVSPANQASHPIIGPAACGVDPNG